MFGLLSSRSAFCLFSTSIKKPQRLTGSRKDWMDRHINDPFVKAAKLVSEIARITLTASIQIESSF